MEVRPLRLERKTSFENWKHISAGQAKILLTQQNLAIREVCTLNDNVEEDSQSCFTSCLRGEMTDSLWEDCTD